MHALTLLSYRYSCYIGTPCSQLPPKHHQHRSSTRYSCLDPALPLTASPTGSLLVNYTCQRDTHMGSNHMKSSHVKIQTLHLPPSAADTCGPSPDAAPKASLASLAPVSAVAASRTHSVLPSQLGQVLLLPLWLQLRPLPTPAAVTTGSGHLQPWSNSSCWPTGVHDHPLMLVPPVAGT